jgi:hypothetical protein
VDWRTGLSGAPCPYEDKPATLGKVELCSAIIHRTIRCATGATATRSNGRLQKRMTDEQCAQSQSRRVRGAPDSEQNLSGGAPDCTVRQEDKLSNGRLSQNPNGWVTWRRTGQCLVAHRTVRCAHRQQPSPTAIWWLRAINTPNHHNTKHPSILNIAFNTRAIDFTPRYNQSDRSTKSPQINSSAL